MIYCKEYGRADGRPYLCLHGWGGDHRDFLPLVARRPEGARLLSLDLPGYARSPRPAAWTMDSILDEIGALIETRRSGPCTLVGFCSGAAMAVLLAQRRPALTRRVVMIDPFAYVPWYFRLFLAGEFGRRAYATTFQSAPGRAIANGILRRMQRSDEDFTRAFASLNHEIALRHLALLNSVDVRRITLDRAIAVDIVIGAHTFGAVRRSVEIFQSLWPQARRHELTGIGHLIMVKGAPQLAELIFT